MSMNAALLLALTISGVVTSNGAPVAGANVTATTGAVHGSTSGYGTVTDADGRFTLANVVPARYILCAQTKSLLTELEIHAAEERELAIELSPQASGAVYGKVRGVSSATVWAGGRLYERNGVVDEEGNYRIEGLRGSFEMFATTSDDSVAPIRQRIDIGPGETKRVDFDFGGAIAVSGRVTLDGRPITARVNFHEKQRFGLRTWSERALVASVMTGPDGRYRVTLREPGIYQIYIEGEALERQMRRAVREIRDSKTLDIDLPSHERPGLATRPVPTEKLQVRVIDARSGTPLYADIKVEDASGAELDTSNAVVGADGATMVYALPPARYWLTVNVFGYASKTVEVAAPATLDVEVE